MNRERIGLLCGTGIGLLFSLCALAELPSLVQFGGVTPRFSLAPNETLAEQRLTLPLTCAPACQHTRLRWERVGLPIPGSPTARHYRFFSALPGIGIALDTRETTPDDPNLTLSLFAIGTRHQTGRLDPTRPLLRWYLEPLHGDSTQPLQSGAIYVAAEIHAGTCAPQQRDLTVQMPPVDIARLKRLEVGEPLTQGAESVQLAIRCTPGVAEGFTLHFLGRHPNDLPQLLSASRGVGFIITLADRQPEQAVRWSGEEGYDGAIPDSGSVDLPLHLYYARSGEPLIPGDVSARGIFLLSYR
ncbi:fimbrial protein [Edwardsiella tarda]|uniref:fimbrial protein n=1 Tax=Edwardsiella tarda TaxID=636 RepID=UPI0034DDB048